MVRTAVGGVGSPRQAFLTPALYQPFIPLLIGAVLVAAALLKAFSLWTKEISEAGLLGSPWFLAGVIDAELLIGLALLVGIQPVLARTAARLLFSAFLGLALSKALAGAKSCACLGSIPVQPWLMSVLDLGALAVIWSWKPSENRLQVSRRTSAMFLGVALLPLSLLGARDSDSYPRLLTSTPTVDLGATVQGQRREFLLHLRNPHDRPVVITQIESSCPCLTARDLPWSCFPGEESSQSLVLDLAKQPDFSGPLLITAKGFSGRNTVLQTEVQVQVTSANY
jgi:hypothetical protein